jgi:hypothetical protein
MQHMFCYNELHTKSPEAAKKFYGEMFGWEMKDLPYGGGGTYTTIETGEGAGGGLQKSDAPSHWLTYILVDDVKLATKRATSLGARVMVDTQTVPDMGVFSVLADPTGAPFAIWQKLS